VDSRFDIGEETSGGGVVTIAGAVTVTLESGVTAGSETIGRVATDGAASIDSTVGKMGDMAILRAAM
jgi:hypothetical protein